MYVAIHAIKVMDVACTQLILHCDTVYFKGVVIIGEMVITYCITLVVVI